MGDGIATWDIWWALSWWVDQGAKVDKLFNHCNLLTQNSDFSYIMKIVLKLLISLLWAVTLQLCSSLQLFVLSSALQWLWNTDVMCHWCFMLIICLWTSKNKWNELNHMSYCIDHCWLLVAAAVNVMTVLCWRRYKVLGISDDTNIGNMGEVQWHLALCLLLGWALVYVCIMKGIKSSGKVSHLSVYWNTRR